MIQLLDRLCSLNASDQIDKGSSLGPEGQPLASNQRVSAMAWAGFQVLANRCVMWENEEGI